MSPEINTIRKLFLLCFFSSLIGLTACTAELAKDTPFDQSSEVGLILVGIDTTELRGNYRAHMYGYNPITKRLDFDMDNESVGRPNSWPDKNNPIDIWVGQLKPGKYVFTSVRTYGYYQDALHCLNIGTPSFDINAGQAIYIGNIAVDSNKRTIRYVGRTDNKALVAIKNYPNINVDLQFVDPELVSYELSRTWTGATSCLGRYPKQASQETE